MNPPYLAILDVGHGSSAVLVDTKGVVVLDAGPRSALLEYLGEQGIRHVDAMLISHADEDHLGGLLAILSSRSVSLGKVRLNTDSAKESKIWNQVAYELDRLTPTIDFEVALTTDLTGAHDCGSVRVEVLGPSKYLATRGAGSTDRDGRQIKTNSMSAVVRLKIGDEPLVVVTGDLDEIGLAELTYQRADCRAPVLVFPHHGGHSGTDVKTFVIELLSLVQPELVVFSLGRGRHGTPRPDVIRTIRSFDAGIRIHCTQLSAHCAADLPKAKPTHLNASFAAGRGKQHCCGGTLVLPLKLPLLPEPAKALHDAFIVASAPTALCR